MVLAFVEEQPHNPNVPVLNREGERLASPREKRPSPLQVAPSFDCRAFDCRAEIQKQPHERRREPRSGRMVARHQQAHRGGSSAVEIGLRIWFGSGPKRCIAIATAFGGVFWR
ncbi:MAG: hypothetical protein JOZ11_20905 [Alphaproteobacteria bacterium]|nr:hypothetical protein [Alphaproteobacteria bacterium]